MHPGVWAGMEMICAVGYDGRRAVTIVMLWISCSCSFTGVFISAAHPVCQHESPFSRSERAVRDDWEPFVLISSPARCDGRACSERWRLMREEEGETVSGGCRVNLWWADFRCSGRRWLLGKPQTHACRLHVRLCAVNIKVRFRSQPFPEQQFQIFPFLYSQKT